MLVFNGVVRHGIQYRTGEGAKKLEFGISLSWGPRMSFPAMVYHLEVL